MTKRNIKVGTKVRVGTGRNAEKIGTVKTVSDSGDVVYVDFGGTVLVRGLFDNGPGDHYPDEYWVGVEHVKLV